MNIYIPHNWLLEYLETDAQPEQIMTELALSGPSVERIETREDEPVYDIEITTNRVDAMSVIGVAREAGVILNQAGLKAKFLGEKTKLKHVLSDGDLAKTIQNLVNEQKKVSAEREASAGQQVIAGQQASAEQQVSAEQKVALPKIEIKSDAVRRVTAIVLEVADGIARQSSPAWLQKRLAQIDVSSHGPLIDITNYLTHEIGHPCHAFDYDKIMASGGEIKIVSAQPKMPFVTLSNEPATDEDLDAHSYETVGGETVFLSAKGEIIDLPGIKGTANTGVDENTRRVLFWFENMDPSAIRFTSMTHAIRTTAATLNEKNVDANLIDLAMVRGIELYQELAGAKIISDLFDYYPKKRMVSTSIQVPLAKIDLFLGKKLPREQIVNILRDLQLEVEQKETELVVRAPSFRGDLNLPVDIIEEIARIYGYGNLDSRIDFVTADIPAQETVNFQFERQMKHFLAARGYFEIYSSSLVSADLQKVESQYPTRSELPPTLSLKNPLTEDKVMLRRELWPSLAEVYLQNMAYISRLGEGNLFEMANVYQGDQPVGEIEELRLTLLSDRPYRQVRADLEAALRQFYIQDLQIDAEGQITLPQEKVGEEERIAIGRAQILSNKEIGELSNKTRLNIFELVIKQILPEVKTYPHLKPLHRYPAIIEDLTFCLEKKIPVAPLLSQMKTVSPLINDIKLIDIYQNRYTFRLAYQAIDKALSNDEITPIRQAVVMAMEKNQGIKLVGTV